VSFFPLFFNLLPVDIIPKNDAFALTTYLFACEFIQRQKEFGSWKKITS